MKGEELKKILKLNGLTQVEASKIFKVSRPTISIWCKSDNVPDKIVRIINERFCVKDSNFNPILSVEQSKMEQIDHCPQCKLLEQIIKEKDNQIAKLLKITEDLTSLLTSK